MFKIINVGDILPDPQDIPDFALMQHQTLHYTLSWSYLELTLANLVSAAIYVTKGNSIIGHAIYNAPTSIEARFAIVDACVISLIDENKKLKRLSNYWDKIYKKLNGLRHNRNILAHGTILVFGGGDKRKLQVRITSPVKNFTYKKLKKLPGLSSNDMKTYLFNIGLVNDLIEKVSEIIMLFHADRRTSLQKKYLELEAHLQKLGGHI